MTIRILKALSVYFKIQLRHWANQHETTSKLDNELKGQGINHQFILNLMAIFYAALHAIQGQQPLFGE